MAERIINAYCRQFPYLCYQSVRTQGRPLGGGPMLFLYFISGSTRHYFPSHGRQLTLCWRTSWESHPSEDLSELLSQKYHYRLTGSWRSSLPKLPWPEWVSLCTLYGRPLMQNTLHRWSSRTRPDAFLFGTVS